MAQRPLAESSPQAVGWTDDDVVERGGLELLPRPRETAGETTGSLRHVLGTILAGLVACAFLVGGGCLVSMAWETHVLLALGCLVALVAVAAGAVGLLMTRPRRR